MDALYYYVGFGVVWLCIVLAIGVASLYAYQAIKTVPLAIDFFQWYRFYAIRHNPEWKSKVGIVHNYIAAFISVWGYNKNTQITHHAGVVYKPYIWR